jgi:uncharacterized membrane protein
MDGNWSAQSLPGAHEHETIESVADLDRSAERRISSHQRWIERLASALGRPRTLSVVVAWVVLNVALAGGGRAFDPPPFAYLDCIISLAALLMTIVILTTENRINAHDAQRDRLDLQINLLNERKISKVIEMLEALRRDSPAVPNRHDPEAREMGRSARRPRGPRPPSPRAHTGFKLRRETTRRDRLMNAAIERENFRCPKNRRRRVLA